MANVRNLGEASGLGNVFQVGGQVVSPELLEAEVPVGLALDIQRGVAERVLVTSVISEPDIVPLVGKI